MNMLAKRMEMWIPLKDFLYFFIEEEEMKLESEVYFKKFWKKMHNQSPPE